MKNLLLTFLVLLQILIVQAQSNFTQKKKVFKLPEGITSQDYIPDVIIIKYKASSESAVKTSFDKKSSAIKNTSLISLEKVFPGQEYKASTFSRSVPDDGLNRIYRATIAKSAEIEEIINELLADPSIEYAEPSYIHHSSYTPNDTRYVMGQQSYLDIVKAPQAWNLIKNSSGIIIGIVDSGSELTHPDLAANIYYNTADPINGIDDDGDGYIDNYAGWDFVGASSSNMKPDNDPTVVGASNDHGVHVSGIASAVTDNAVGVSSIAFNAKLLIVKAGPDDSGSDIYRGYEGIKYAADKGANIINCSWGSKGGGSFGRDIIEYAINKGCLIVAAAGNSGTETPEYPAAYNGVLSIANSENDDTRASSSSYGHYVTLSAPGNSILSTIFNKNYGQSSGTSMSSPVVSSAAALVKSYFPLLSMQQVGELIRITADNIDNKNPGYEGKMGKGRLNVFRALSETPPSVRIQHIKEEEHVSTNSLLSDTLYLYVDIKNFLFPVINLQLTLNTSNVNANVLTSQLTVPALATLETKNLIGPFKVLINAKTPANSTVQFRLSYSANNNSYQDFEGFSVIVAKDYLDISTGAIVTTLTSKGRIGYSETAAENGSGFIFKGTQLLYEASLLIGVSPSMVSDNARTENEESNEHFIKTIRAHELSNTMDSVVAESAFDDSGNPNRLNITVKQKMTAYKSSPNDNYIIAEYQVFNTTNYALKNVYVGLFTDWDIGSGSTNVTQYDAPNRLAYIHEKQGTGLYGGVKLLNQDAPPAYYPMSYNVSGNPLSDDVFTQAEKWESLSSGIKALGMGTTTSSGVDVFFVSGNGPYEIPANGSIKVAFALLGGESLSELQSSAGAAQQKYNRINIAPKDEDSASLTIFTYPNPIISSNNSLNTIRFTLPEAGKVSVEMFNVKGQKIKTLISNEAYSSGVHYLNYDFNSRDFLSLDSGIYFYRLSCNDESKTIKISLLR